MRFEGRGWRGFHHHGTLCIAAYGFLISEQETIPPSGPRSPGDARNLPFPTVADRSIPALAARTPHARFDRHYAQTAHRRDRQTPAALPLLPLSQSLSENIKRDYRVFAA